MEAAIRDAAASNHQVVVAGIGPGNPDYMVPAAREAIRQARVLVGGRRALEQFAQSGQEQMPITRDIEAVMDFIEERLDACDVVVMASGDPGYYSILDALRRWFPAERIRVIPGISSFQLAFSRLALPWHEARLLSMHGRRPPSSEFAYRQGGLLGILTDAVHNSHTVPQMLMEQGWPPEAELYICSRLSYEDEQMTATTLGQSGGLPMEAHCVLVVRDTRK